MKNTRERINSEINLTVKKDIYGKKMSIMIEHDISGASFYLTNNDIY